MNKPCSECPFRRDVDPAICASKNSHPASFVGQAFGPFFLPCHKQAAFTADACDPALAQCPGAAAFRANAGVFDQYRFPPGMLRLPADPVTFFATPEEFLAHHMSLTPAEAAEWLRDCPPELLCQIELRRAGVRIVQLTTNKG